MDTLETLLTTALPPDISSAPFAEGPDERQSEDDASIEDVAERIDHSIFAAMVAS